MYIISIKLYIKQEAFKLSITTWHKSDRGSIENVHNLEGEALRRRDIVYIDIANDHCRPAVRCFFIN